MNKYYTIHFAQAYGEGSYGACTYNDSTSCSTSSGGSSGSSPSGTLANTGIMVAGFVTLACVIVFAALVVRVWRRPSKKIAPEAAAADNEEDELETK